MISTEIRSNAVPSLVQGFTLYKDSISHVKV